MPPQLRFSTWCMTAALMFAFCSPGYSDGYYTWTDENGNVHISDSLGNVPEKFRNQLKRETFDNEKNKSAEPSNTPPQQGPRADTKDRDQQPNRYEVPYEPYGGSAKRVIIEAVFNGSVNARMAIDTGAPNTVLSSSLAKKIGLFDKDQGKLRIMAGGIGGLAPAVRSIVDTIQVGGAKIEFVPVTIIASVSKSFDGLLGLDFVSNYSVTIDSKRKLVVFEELPRDPEHPGGHDQEWWTSLFKEFADSRNEWKAYGEALDKEIKESLRANDEEDAARKAFAEQQYHEAEKLLDKLDGYARENYVPVHWKKY